jgi:hypothetical protein
MKKLAAKFLRGCAYVWLTQATLLILSTVAFEFYRGGFWHGWNTYAVWFSPFNVNGLINYLVNFGPPLLLTKFEFVINLKTT